MNKTFLSKMRTVVYSNGLTSPQIQFGTFRIKTSEDVETSISEALNTGYRAIDTASVYKNHAKIAKTLRECLPKLGLTRSDIWLTSKLAPKDHGEKRCEEAIGNILRDLDTDYLDLLLIHWPGVQRLEVTDPQNRILRQESWRVLERFYRDGKLRSIGVSNYTQRHLEELLDHCEVAPHVLQTELHPHYQQTELVKFCRLHNIHVQAYSSLGQAGPESPLFRSEAVVSTSDELGLTPAQVLLTWGIQSGYTVMPKSVTPSRIRENFQLGTKLSKDVMKRLNELEKEVSEKYAWDPVNVV